MPEGVPPAALRPEPQLPVPPQWPFGEDFPRTCGTGRLAGGAAFWTDFIYDDHGATGVPWDLPHVGLSPPRGTYTYPDGPAANNGADIFRVGIGLTDTDSWWRVDWNTLVEANVPIALFTMDTDRNQPGVTDWPAGADVRSPGIDLALLISGQGAWLIDLETNRWDRVERFVDLASRSFLARLPRALVEPTGTWTVRLAAGVANEKGDGFSDVHLTHGAVPGQPPVYNLAFRTHTQEPTHLNFWSDEAQAAALSDGNVSAFSLAVTWDRLAAAETTPEPVVLGPSVRWYVSSLELGQGVADRLPLSSKPHFLGRVQPYSVYLPATYSSAQQVPLTLLLHSLQMGLNQFASIDPDLLSEISESRGSIAVTTAARGPGSWFFDEGELDLWEVWARVAEQLNTDPNRTVIAGYSMGGYGAYKVGLTYPEVFTQAVAIAGPPACGIRLWPGMTIPGDLDPDSPCGHEGDTWPLLPNARWLPFVIEHGGLDEFVPLHSVLQQVYELDRLGYRYRFTVYPYEDHLVFALQDEFDAAHRMGTGLRSSDPGHITFGWYPQLVREDLGIGPHRVWWLSELKATPEITARRGATAHVDARSYARPDLTRSTRRHGGAILRFDPAPGAYLEQDWRTSSQPARLPVLTLSLRDVASLTVDLARAGFQPDEPGRVSVATNNPVQITLQGLPAEAPIRIDGTVTSGGASVSVPAGRHEIEIG
ncbi:MAG TPA: alpha/beta hydrolase-fold protein [Frankiaceae bacterium]|nr:alpha/beta hydrolase-fold protein [Frankiaceae bacterium]